MSRVVVSFTVATVEEQERESRRRRVIATVALVAALCIPSPPRAFAEHVARHKVDRVVDDTRRVLDDAGQQQDGDADDASRPQRPDLVDLVGTA